MKNSAFILNMLLAIFLFAQPEKFTELNGLADAQGNTHLFYRHYKANVWGYNWVSEIRHFDLAANSNILFVLDFYINNNLWFATSFTTEIDFFDRDPAQYIYYYTQAEIDPSAFIERYDGTVFTELGESGRLAISAQNDSLLYAGHPWSGIMKSTDRGDTWEDIPGIMYDILFLELSPFNDNVLFAVNYDSQLLKSTDGGLTFSTVDSAGHWNTRHNLKFDAGGMHIFAVDFQANQYHLFRSSDAGNSWQTILSDSSSMVVETDPLISGKLYLSVGNQILTSSDFGNTFADYWNLPFDIVGLYKKPDFDLLYGATNFDIYEITPTDTVSLVHLPIVGIENPPGNLIRQFELKQNYPNPFNPATTIEFSLSQSQHVLLRVFDITGKEIAVLINGKIPPGLHKITFDGNNLASGIYFYQLQGNDFSETKKMALMK